MEKKPTTTYGSIIKTGVRNFIKRSASDIASDDNVRSKLQSTGKDVVLNTASNLIKHARSSK